MVGGQSTHIPLKVNTASVIPIIFAQSILQFPVMIANFVGKGKGSGLSKVILDGLTQNNWCDTKNWTNSWGLVLYILMVVAFAYFYTSITFNPLEVADNMKKQGGFIPGIRPGKPETYMRYMGIRPLYSFLSCLTRVFHYSRIHIELLYSQDFQKDIPADRIPQRKL